MPANDRQGDESVNVRLSVPAARFLVGMVEHLNSVKALPDTNPGQALQTSAWLEEIAAAARKVLPDAR